MDDSVALWIRAQDSIAQGALTNSKHPDRFIFGVYPTHVVKAEGCHLYDEYKNRYADYICGLGANLYGYGNPKISDAVKSVLNLGACHSLPTNYEIEAAEALKTMFYFIDKWKFLKTGTEACMSSIKMARSYTGRKKVLSDGYHGHADEFVSLSPPASGIHTCTDIFPLKNFIDNDFSDIAAVIIEPVITDYSPERVQYLLRLREKCDKFGTVLIFDEVITGFRFQKYSVAQAFNIYPDLFIIGKAMAGGLPLAAVGGKKKIMDGDYFVSSTYAGDIFSLAACKATVDLAMRDPAYSVEKLWDIGEVFMKKFNSMTEHLGLSIVGYPSRGSLNGLDVVKALFMQEACKAGFLFGPSWFYNTHLILEDHNFFTFLKDFVQNMNLNQIKLEGRMPTSPFSARSRN